MHHVDRSGLTFSSRLEAKRARSLVDVMVDCGRRSCECSIWCDAGVVRGVAQRVAGCCCRKLTLCTGDVLLFRSRSVGAMVGELARDETFSHVGLVINEVCDTTMVCIHFRAWLHLTLSKGWMI
jgi:hypothetical protein